LTERKERPQFPQKTQTACPRCDSESFGALPRTNPSSDQDWFCCAACGHMWAQRRDRSEQGE